MWISPPINHPPFSFGAFPADSEFNHQNQTGDNKDTEEINPRSELPKRVSLPPYQTQPSEPKPRIAGMRQYCSNQMHPLFIYYYTQLIR